MPPHHQAVAVSGKFEAQFNRQCDNTLTENFKTTK